jgi:hypothetical protein
MNVDLECECAATGDWVLIARFKSEADAGIAARSLSVLTGSDHRTIDRRWPDRGDIVTNYGKDFPA